MARKRKPDRDIVLETKDAAQKPRTERSRSPSVNPVLGLQRTIGNRAVNELLAPGAKQPYLRVSKPGEPAELEADRVSRAVAGVESGGTQTGHAEMDGRAEYEAPDVTADLGVGRPLDAATRSDMEARFGHDLSNVRIHTDSWAAESARAVDARAYTFGKDIVFGAGEYAPEKKAGKQTLAHELTHVVQQGAARRSSSSGSMAAVKNVTPAPAGKVIQRQPVPAGKQQGSGAPAATATPQMGPPQLTQVMFDRAIAILAKLSGVDARLLAILKQGKVGTQVSGVKVINVAPANPGDPAVQLTCTLEISPTLASLQQGAAAEFVEDPRNQTNVQGDAAKGITITRLLKIIAKPAASDNEMAWSLLHEGMHMLLAIDRMLDQFAGTVPGLAAGSTGAFKTFAQYQQAGKTSAKRVTLVSGLVGEINRVQGLSAPPPAAPAPSNKPPASSGSGAPPPASAPPAAPSASSIADAVIDEILEERFAFDQQLKQIPGSKTVTNSSLASAYMFGQLAFALGLKNWPTAPNQQALVTLMAVFLDDVELLLNPPAPASSGKPAPSGNPPKKP